MTVTSATSNPSTSYSNIATASSSVARAPKKALGQEDFLKLLATQFQQQDPMKPMDDTAFIAQMAQFSSLEQTSTMVADLTQMRADQSLLTGSSYIGRNVTVDDGSGNSVSGLVTSLNNDPTNGVTLTIAGKSYPLTSVRRVEPAGPTGPNPTSAAPVLPTS